MPETVQNDTPNAPSLPQLKRRKWPSVKKSNSLRAPSGSPESCNVCCKGPEGIDKALLL